MTQSRESDTERLTQPQRDALSLLADVHPMKVGAHKRRTQADPMPRVNVRAANELSRKGLASIRLPDSRFWSPYRCDYKFEATQAGLDTVAAWDTRGSL